MELTYFKKHWWMPVLFGITLIIVALLKIYEPSKGFIAIKIIMGWLIFTNGLGNTAYAIKNKKEWLWYLLIGIVEIGLGAAIVLYPTLFARTFVIFVGFWFVLTSISRISLALSLKRSGESSWWIFLISGIIIGLLSILVIANPIFAKLYLVYFVALALLLVGYTAIRFGIQIKKTKELEE